MTMSDGSLEMEQHPKWKKFLYGAAFICLMLAGFLTVFSLRNRSADTPDALEGWILGAFTPQILVDNTPYYWTGMAQKHTGADTPGAQVSSPGDGSTYLPEGHTEYGAFLATVDAPPTEDLQLQADFSAFGTVYRNPETHEVIYILMTTDWFQNQYVRFTSREIYDGARIAWNGQHYRTVFTDGLSTPLEALPEGAVSVGTLHFIGEDRIPQQDLETNCLCDNYAYSLEGREVFAIPGQTDAIFVHSRSYWSGGSSDVYWKCPVW